jgi:hypothetical protein
MGMIRSQRKESTAPTVAAPNRRSNARLSVRVPVLAYGWSKRDGSFHEETTTLLVNASGALAVLAARVELGDTIFVVNKATKEERECRVAYVGAELQGKARVGFAFNRPAPSFWRVDRKEQRINKKALRVWVRGVDRKGQPFTQSAFAFDFSLRGARLDGTGYLTWPGETIELKRRWRSARFRVVWVGEIGTLQAGQVGVFALEPDKNFWGLPSPKRQSSSKT